MSTRTKYMRERRGGMSKEAGFANLLGSAIQGIGGALSSGGRMAGRAAAAAPGAIGNAARSVGGFLGHPGTAVGLGLLGLGANAYQGHRADQALAAAQQLSLTQIARMFPEIHDADPQIVQSIWGAITQFAPHVATNPRVAGTFMRSILQFPGQPITPAQIRELQQLELGMMKDQDSGSALKSFTETAGGINQVQQMLGVGKMPPIETSAPEGHFVRDFPAAANAYEQMTDQSLKDTKTLDDWMKSQNLRYSPPR